VGLKIVTEATDIVGLGEGTGRMVDVKGRHNADGTETEFKLRLGPLNQLAFT
jgi:hypothetical protein